MIIDKDNIKILLIILIVGLGIGYAYINSDLNINGTAQVNSANWDVHWANIQVTNGSVSGSSVVTQPTISNQTTVNYSIILNTPGDYYEFTVDAVNGGSIDAMIDTIDSKLNGATITTLPAYLNYSVTYSSGAELEPNHQLLHNTTETYKVRVEYNTEINANQIPASNQTLSLQFTVTYRQATEDAVEVDHTITRYTTNLCDENVTGDNSILIGQAIPSDITQYSSASDAMAAFSNRPIYLKHKIQNGIVTESYVGFVVTQAMANANPGMTAGTYALRGLDTYDENASTTDYCKAEYYNSVTEECLSPYYETNKEILLSAFGSSNCYDSENTELNYRTYLCSIPGSETPVVAYSYGRVEALYHDNGDWLCIFNRDGSSYCSSPYGC